MRSSLRSGLSVAFCVSTLGLAVIAHGAAAQERPRYVPTRDVTVNYQVTSDQPGVPPNVVAHISATGQLRLESPEHGVVLYDAGSGRAEWLLPQSNFYVDLPVRNSLVGAFAPNAEARFTREGQGRVAGLACTRWRVTAPRGTGTACVTADGIILSGDGGDARGHTGSITATSVAYAPQAAELFAPPPGMKHVELPRGLSLPRPPQ